MGMSCLEPRVVSNHSRAASLASVSVLGSLGLMAPPPLRPPHATVMGAEVPNTQSDTREESVLGKGGQECRGDEIYFLNCGKIYVIKFTIFTIFKCPVQ